MVSDKKNLSVTDKILCERIDKYLSILRPIFPSETQMEILKNIRFIVSKKIVKL